MRIMFIRLRQTFGWGGGIGLLVVVSVLVCLVRLGAGSIYLAVPGIVLVVGAAMAALRWGRYERPTRTVDCDEALPGLIASDEAYCLVLRSFGSDGRTVVRSSRGWRMVRLAGLAATVTLEQVVAQAARAEMGMRTFAMVDHNQALAPPGPNYVRAPHDRWKPAALALIRRAHSIVLILHPGQDLRASFGWEIEQITHHELQSRVFIVLPPVDRDVAGYRHALQQSCVLVAALDGFAGTKGDVNPLDVLRWESGLSERTQVIKISRRPAERRVQVLHWTSTPKRRSVVGAITYAQCLRPAFQLAVRELDGIGFAQRYPAVRRLP